MGQSLGTFWVRYTVPVAGLNAEGCGGLRGVALALQPWLDLYFQCSRLVELGCQVSFSGKWFVWLELGGVVWA